MSAPREIKWLRVTPLPVSEFIHKLSVDVEADIKRLTGLGATLLEGPIQIPGGTRIAFLQGPDDTRLELVERKIAGGSGQCC